VHRYAAREIKNKQGAQRGYYRSFCFFYGAHTGAPLSLNYPIDVTVPINTGRFVVLSIIAYTNGLSRFTVLGANGALSLTISTFVTAPAFVPSSSTEIILFSIYYTTKSFKLHELLKNFI